MNNKVIKFFAIVSIFCLLSMTTMFSACKQTPDYLSYVSEFRKDVFCGEKDNFSVVVFAGSKEKPATFDGDKKDTFLFLTFKVMQKEECGSAITVNFEIGDKKYSQQLQFNPVKSTLSCDVEVAALPEKNLTVELIFGENSTVITTYSKLNEDTVKYTDALNKAIEKAQPFLKEHTKDGVLKAEIVVRLLCENDKNYYYVGFVCEEGLKQAYLIDGKTCQIIAEKTN